MHSVELYRDLGAEVELETGWREVGSLRLASSTERMEELQRQAAWAETFGLPLHLVSPEEAQKLFPPMSIEGVHGAAFLPTDGYLDPSQLTLALAKGRAPARRHDPHRHPGHRRSTSPTAGCGASRPTRAGSSARSSSTPAASTPTRSAGWPACTCPSCPWRTST